METASFVSVILHVYFYFILLEIYIFLMQLFSILWQL